MAAGNESWPQLTRGLRKSRQSIPGEPPLGPPSPGDPPSLTHRGKDLLLSVCSLAPALAPDLRGSPRACQGHFCGQTSGPCPHTRARLLRCPESLPRPHLPPRLEQRGPFPRPQHLPFPITQPHPQPPRDWLAALVCQFLASLKKLEAMAAPVPCYQMVPKAGAGPEPGQRLPSHHTRHPPLSSRARPAALPAWLRASQPYRPPHSHLETDRSFTWGSRRGRGDSDGVPPSCARGGSPGAHQLALLVSSQGTGPGQVPGGGTGAPANGLCVSGCLGLAVRHVPGPLHGSHDTTSRLPASGKLSTHTHS